MKTRFIWILPLLLALSLAANLVISYNQPTSMEAKVALPAKTDIVSTFAPDLYTLTTNVIPPGSGAVSANSTGPYPLNAAVQLTAAPSAGYNFSNWSGDASGSANPLNYTVTGNNTVTANFAIQTLTINASVSGGHGAATPATQTVNYGSSATINIIPDPGYGTASITDNGSAVAISNPYVINNVIANHTVVVTFVQTSYSLTLSVAPANSGSVSANPTAPYHYGDIVRLTATPVAGYSFSNWSGDASGTTNPLDFTIIGNNAITANFIGGPFIVNALVRGGSGIVTANPVVVNSGGSSTVTLTPSTGFHLVAIIDNYADVLNQVVAGTYTLNNITTNHSVEATFAINTYTITPTTGSGGTISPAGAQIVNYGDTPSFAITPNVGYAISDVVVDGTTSVKSQLVYGVYTFPPITSNHTIAATFTQSTKTTFNTDYYSAFVNSNGTLKFVNKTTGTDIVDNSPGFFLNYGNNTVQDVSPYNSSFEIDTNSDGIPDGWTVNNPNIRQSSDYASQGTKSLRFNMTAPDTDHRRAYSPLITCSPNNTYSISVDSYYGSHVGDHWFSMIYISYYMAPDGSGPENSGDVQAQVTPILGSSGVFSTIRFSWNPPLGAKSFRILFYADKNEVASLYFDNLKVNEITPKYETASTSLSPTVTTSGDNITVQSIDNSHPEVTVANRYDINVHSPNVTFTSTLTYKQNVTVSEERFDFLVPTQTASVMTRDLKLNNYDTTREYYADLYTPKVVKFNNGLSFLGTDTMQSMKLRANGASSQLTFYSDYYLNHPFSYWVKNGNGATVDISSQQRLSGSSHSSSVTFNINPGATPKSLVKTRQPNGYDATLVFTNHPDYETLGSINAVAYGTEDTSSPAYGTKGILGRKIGWTKAVFVSGYTGVYPPYIDLANPVYKALTDKMAQDGAEIIGHTITPSTDSRTVVDSGMQFLSQYKTRDWIDHGAEGGSGNWEALASQGTIKGDQNYSLDLFAKYGYNYAWSYKDFTTDSYSLNILSPASTGKKTPCFYYNNNVDDNPGHDNAIYLWPSLPTNQLVDLYYTNANVDSLISQRGIHIGHEYMGYAGNENHAWYTNPSTGKIEIYPAFDNELAYIASQRDAGLLWTPTVSQLGDYLVLLPKVMVVNNPDGTFTVTNNNPTSISGLTLLAESAIWSVTLNGKPLPSFGGSYGANEIVLPSLAAGQSVTLAISYGTQAIAPSVTTNAASNVSGNTVALNGNLTALGTAQFVSVSFEYGLAPSYGNTTPIQTMTNQGSFSASLSGLTGGTYHFRAKAVGDGTAYGNDQTFAINTYNITPSAGSGGTISPSTMQTVNYGDTPSFTIAPNTGYAIADAVVDGTTSVKSQLVNGVYTFPPITSNHTIAASFTQSNYSLSVTINPASGGSVNIDKLGPYHLNDVIKLTAAAAAGYNFGGWSGDASGTANPLNFTITGNNAITATFTLIPVSGGGGGGFGGGGGGGGSGGGVSSPTSPVTLTGLTANGSLTIDTGSAVQNNVELETTDGNLILDVSKGTRLIDANGNPLKTLTVSPLTGLPDPSPNIILLAYNIGPDGAKFDPALILVLNYNSLKLPPEASENDLFLAFWNGSRWVDLPGRVDTQAKTISSNISHFSNYALIVRITTPAPAKFSQGDISITPVSVGPDTAVSIQTKVTNIGGIDGTYSALLYINGQYEDVRLVNLKPGQMATVDFRTTKNLPGTYAVDVNGAKGQFTVVTPQPTITTQPPSRLPSVEVKPTPTPTLTPEVLTPTVVPSNFPSTTPGAKTTFSFIWVFVVAVGILIVVVSGLSIIRRAKK